VIAYRVVIYSVREIHLVEATLFEGLVTLLLIVFHQYLRVVTLSFHLAKCSQHHWVDLLCGMYYS
jgi:hypothetical protein